MKFLAALLALAFALAARAVEPVRAERGMVVSSHRLASEVGVKILQSGGNAIDAAVATGMALAVTHPSAGNIGGGGFMVVFTKSGEATTFDFREKAPLAATERMYLDAAGTYSTDANHEGYRAVGVPGTVAGFDLALKKFGTKTWRELAEPAVRMAEEGFPLSPALAGAIGRLQKDWKKYPASQKVFLQPDGSPFQPGATWKQPDLARTLRRIQSGGRAGFYVGETPRLIAADMKAHGGIITESDLAAYEAKERAPIRGTFRGYEIISMPPPSSGGVAIVEMLNILEGYDLKKQTHNSAPYVHLLAESMRRAFMDRARYIGDPDFNKNLPIAFLTSKDHAKNMRARIHPDRAGKSLSVRDNGFGESNETTHYSVMDAEGNAVVVTYTLEYSYGSRIVADGLGFLYNNEMGDFNPQPGRTDATGLIGTRPNVIAPGKRMLSSMTPTIVVRDGKPVLLVGSPGGRTIINTVLQVILNHIEFNMNIADAVAASRLHHQWLPDQITLERGKFTPETLQALRALGHTVNETARQGEAMAIAIDPKTNLRQGAADPRTADGAAIGY